MGNIGGTGRGWRGGASSSREVLQLLSKCFTVEKHWSLRGKRLVVAWTLAFGELAAFLPERATPPDLKEELKDLKKTCITKWAEEQVPE